MMGKLYAISDLHVSHPLNQTELAKMTGQTDVANMVNLPEDSLIIAGDVGETSTHLHSAFSILRPLFKTVWWVPGNHELYSLPSRKPSESTAKLARQDDDDRELRGVEKYKSCVRIAHEYNILTPDDEFVSWTGTSASGEPISALICPLFLLYDYTFRPDHITSTRDALAWAEEEGLVATDEALLHCEPYESKEAWCHALCAASETRLATASEKARTEGLKLVMINHWPLRQSLAYLPLVPRFKIWCGTTLTENWARKFEASVVVGGHCHIRRTDWIEGVRYEEVSLGYPNQWKEAREMGKGVKEIMREILPGPTAPTEGESRKTNWRRHG